MKRTPLSRSSGLKRAGRNGLKRIERADESDDRIYWNVGCYLSRLGVHESGEMPNCDGALIRAHLLPRQLLMRELRDTQAALKAIDDPRSWVPACGGPTGCSGHHGMFDTSRTLRLPFGALPAGTVELAEELGLSWWLSREYESGENVA